MRKSLAIRENTQQFSIKKSAPDATVAADSTTPQNGAPFSAPNPGWEDCPFHPGLRKVAREEGRKAQDFSWHLALRMCRRMSAEWLPHIASFKWLLVCQAKALDKVRQETGVHCITFSMEVMRTNSDLRARPEGGKTRGELWP